MISDCTSPAASKAARLGFERESMARLVVNPDSAEAWEIELRPGTNSLGRSPENDFTIDHASVSSSHCRIEVSDASAVLKDVGSTCGTFIDGQLVEQVRLRSGQVFCLGDVQLRFEADPAPEAVSGPAREVVGRRAGAHRHRSPGWAIRLCGAFLYPFAKDGVVLLVAGTVFLSIIEAGKFFARYAAVKGIGLGSVISSAFLLLITAFGIGYLASYLRRVVICTAMGEPGAPDWPDLTDFVSEVVSPLFQLAATTFVSLAPAIIVGMFIEGTESWSQAVLWIACAFGGFYFPMAFLAVSLFDSVAALNPLLVASSVLKIPGPYLVSVALFGAVLAAKWYGDYFLAMAIPVPIVPAVVSTLLGLYLLMVEARVLGLLYLMNHERLAWFARR